MKLEPGRKTKERLEFQAEYAAALRDYAMGGGEAVLGRAYELGRRRDEAAFALLRLEHDRGDRVGRDLRVEGAAKRGERIGGTDAAVLVRERDAVDLRRERPEAGFVRMRLRGQRE